MSTPRLFWYVEQAGRVLPIRLEKPQARPLCHVCQRPVEYLAPAPAHESAAAVVSCHGKEYRVAKQADSSNHVDSFLMGTAFHPTDAFGRWLPYRLPTRFVTVRDPYAWALAEGHKPVENRTKRPGPDALGEWVAIHAAKEDAGAPARKGVGALCGRDALPAHASGQQCTVLAVARLVGWASVHRITTVLDRALDVPGKLDSTLGGCVDEEAARAALQRGKPWLNGAPYAWILDRVRRVPPSVTFPGNLGLQRLHVEHAVELGRLANLTE